MTALLLYGSVALVGLLASALYSGMETGLYTLNRVRLTVRATHGDRRARRLRRMLQSPTQMLSTLLIGNNLANYAGTYGIAAILAERGYGSGQAIVINAGILIPLLFIFGETLPKDLFRTHTDRWSYATSGLLTASGWVFTITGLGPIVRGFARGASRLFGTDSASSTSARQRISQLVKEGVGAGLLSESQTGLVDRALALRDRTVMDEMVPWPGVLRIRLDAEPSALARILRRHNVTRLPVVDRTGAVVGVLSLMEMLLEPEASIETLMQPAMRLDPTTSVPDALRRMRDEHRTMAIVVAEGSNQPVGLVTLKDLVEPLTGELAAW